MADRLEFKENLCTQKDLPYIFSVKQIFLLHYNYIFILIIP